MLKQGFLVNSNLKVNKTGRSPVLNQNFAASGGLSFTLRDLILMPLIIFGLVNFVFKAGQKSLEFEKIIIGSR